MSFGRRIQDLRKAKNITQRELAEKIGKGVSTVQKYEIDVITPPIDVISRIAEALNTDIGNILDRDLTLAEVLEERDIDIKRHPEKYEQVQHNGNVYTQLKDMKQDIIEKYVALNSLGKTTANGIITYLSTKEEFTKPDEE